jgi:hypothetical protein
VRPILILCALSLSAFAAEDRDEVLAQHMRTRVHSLVGCYELEELAEKKGRIELEVQPDGEVSGVTIEGVPQPVSSCVMNRVKTWKFPPGRGGPRRVSWSLLFVPSEEGP